jgi:hypothetical protein
VSTRRRDLVAGASALALLSGSSAAFAQSKEAPAESRAKSAAGSGTGGGITIQGGSLARPANQEELKALLQAACHNGGGIAFDGSTPPIKISGTLEIRLRDVGDGGVYLNGNGLRLESTNRDGVTAAVRFIGKTRFLTIQGFNLYGGGYDTPGCGNGFEFVSSGGDIALSTFSNLVASYCGGHGIVFKGAIFESDTYSLKSKDCRGQGIVFSNQGGVVSNMMMYGTNSSRNAGWGMDLQGGCNSVDMFGGSFVLNGGGGINCPNGFRFMIAPNGENTGETMINMPFAAYPATVIAANLSSNGRVLNPANPNAKPSRYLINPPANGKLNEIGGFVVPYTENSQPAPSNMSVLATQTPATRPKP